MKNNTNNIVDYINKNTNLKDKRVYMSLLYLNKYILKDTVIKDFGKISQNFEHSLVQQKHMLDLIPKTNATLTNMKILVALNAGIIGGIIIGKFFL